MVFSRPGLPERFLLPIIRNALISDSRLVPPSRAEPRRQPFPPEASADIPNMWVKLGALKWKTQVHMCLRSHQDWMYVCCKLWIYYVFFFCTSSVILSSPWIWMFSRRDYVNYKWSNPKFPTRIWLRWSSKRELFGDRPSRNLQCHCVLLSAILSHHCLIMKSRFQEILWFQVFFQPLQLCQKQLFFWNQKLQPSRRDSRPPSRATAPDGPNWYRKVAQHIANVLCQQRKTAQT